MGLKRLFKKSLIGGGNIVYGHVTDALVKKRKTGKSFRECLGDSVSETIKEDLPGTSHIYQSGRKDGRIQGTAEQAQRDARKFEQLEHNHASDRKRWNAQKQQYEELLDDAEYELSKR